jgi:S-adenosylmethionine-diacylglycerol 3-amino-3-carboxypropyl transferase
MSVDFVDPLTVSSAGRRFRLSELLRYHPELASRLHAADRVRTYGSFYIADLAGTAA